MDDLGKDGQIIGTITAEGVLTAHLFGAGKTGVILYQDAFGPRPALFRMAERIAEWGCAVLVPDLFYRLGAYDPFDARTAFGDDAERVRLRGMMAATPSAQTLADGAVFLRVLRDAGVTGGVATLGYCMGGARALSAAAAYPDRIVAAASFHGGNLASDQPDSPHLQAAALRARVYVGVAGVDGSFPPEQSARLALALRAAEVDHVIECYKGVSHGWTVLDNASYDKAGSERHFRRLEVLLREALPG